MPFTILFSFKTKPPQRVPWPGDLESAKTHAINYLSVHNADFVEVSDNSGKLVFSKPEENTDP